MPKSAKSQPYHHGDLRRALIDAALELIVERGIHSLSLREAARKAGVSSGAPYRHFADKEALLLAIADEGNQLLARSTECELAMIPDADPVTEFRTRGVAFVLFAAQYPVHFRLMHSPDVRAIQKASMCTEDELATLLSREPNLRAKAVQVSLAGQCLAYGLASMIVDGELPQLPKDESLLRQFAVSILDVLGEGIAYRAISGK